MLDAWSMSINTNNMELNSWNNGDRRPYDQPRSSSTSNVVVDIDLNEMGGGGTNDHQQNKNGDCCSCYCSSCARSQQKKEIRLLLVGRRSLNDSVSSEPTPLIMDCHMC